MNKLKVILIDDEQLILDNLTYILNQFENIDIIYKSTNPMRVLNYVEDNTDVDVMFVDISMPILSGLEVAGRVFNIDPNIKIVFVTAYDKYVMNSFSVNTVDYILKPVTHARVARTLAKLEKLVREEEKYRESLPELEIDASIAKLTGMKDKKYYVIDADDAYYIMALDREVFLYTKEEEFKLKNNLNYWEGKLKGAGWIRCHRSFLINTNHIKSIAPMFNSTFNITLMDRQEEIPVSRSYINKFKKALNM